MQGISYYIILGFIVITLLVSLFKKHNAYESFIKGAKESMKMGISVLSYMTLETNWTTQITEVTWISWKVYNRRKWHGKTLYYRTGKTDH